MTADTDLVLPHDLDAERAVLGACLKNPKAYPGASARLGGGQDFYREAHRIIWRQMGATADAGDPIDLVTVGTRLATAKQFENIGGPAYLSSLTDGVPSSMHVDTYARIVIDKARLRRTIDAASRVLNTAYRGNVAGTTEAIMAMADLAVDAPEELSRVPLLDDVELQNLPDPEFLIDGVFQERSVAVVYAPPGIGKTTFAAAAAVSGATTKAFFGRRVLRPFTSIAVTAEDPSGFKARLGAAKRAAGCDLTTPIGVFTYPEAIDLRDPTSVTRFQHFVIQQKPRFPQRLGVCFVDTYAAATPGAAENSSEDTTMAMAHARQLCEALDCTIVLVHHTNASGNRERGHTAMRGHADTMIALTPVDDLVQVEVSKQRNGPSGQLIATLKLVSEPNGPGMVFRLASDVLSGDLTPNQAKALAALRDTFADAGATSSEWQRACADIPERTFFRVVKMLLENGWVTMTRPRYRLSGKAGACPR